jgi:hypothetical protein
MNGGFAEYCAYPGKDLSIMLVAKNPLTKISRPSFQDQEPQ